MFAEEREDKDAQQPAIEQRTDNIDALDKSAETAGSDGGESYGKGTPKNGQKSRG